MGAVVVLAIMGVVFLIVVGAVCTVSERGDRAQLTNQPTIPSVSGLLLLLW